MRKTPKLLLVWLVTVLSVVGFVGGFTIVVDPFGYFGTNRLGYYFSSERQFKFSLVRSYDYNSIMLGDSRIGFTDPTFINLPGFRFVNGGIAGAEIPELLSLLSASRLDRLKLAIIGLIYGDLKRCNTSAAVAEHTSWDALRFAASWSQFNYAFKTIKARARERDPRYHADGTRSIVPIEFRDAGFSAKTKSYWDRIRMKVEGSGGFHAKLGAECRVLLKKARALSDRYGFALVVVFLPRDTDLLSRWQTDSPEEREEIRTFLNEIRGVLPHVVDLTNSSFSDSGNFYLDDPTHFRPEVGARVIEEAIRQSFEAQASK